MPVSADLRIGTELAGYRIGVLVGRGGMGVVYRAHDLALDRDVALKLLAPHLADDVSFRERFLTESRVAASLEHPNVVPIHDAGEIDGQLYIVMRLVEGRDLKAVLREGPIEPARAVRVLEQVAGALEAAHARGLVHRDVKPSNVLLDEREHVYLADFGLSRYLGDAALPLGPAKSLGTADYVAPEQIRGEEVDGRADVYALGCMLYECLAGVPPFRRGTDAATLYAQLEEAPPALPGLEEVLPKALAKEPDNRYESCGALVSAVRSVFGLDPRRRRWPMVVASVGVALIGAALLAFFLTTRDGNSTVLPGTDSLVRIDPATNDVVSNIRVGQNPSAVSVGARAVWVASRDDGTIWRVDPATNRVALKVSAHGKPTEVAVDATRAIVSNGPQDANVTVIDAPTGREESVISLVPGTGGFGSAHVATGRSGLWVATADRRVGRLDLLFGKIRNPVFLPPPRTEHGDAYFTSIAVSDDSAWVTGDLNDPTLWRIDAKTGKLKATIPLPSAPKDVAVGAGAVWLTSQLDDTVSRVDIATNTITNTIAAGRGAAGLAVGAGSVWVANAIDGTVSRIDPETLEVTDTIEVGGSPEDVAVSKDGAWVATHEIANAGGEADDTVRIGVLTACEGAFGALADASMAGSELPLLQRGAKLAGARPASGVTGATVAGKKVELFFACGDDTAEKALSEARRLVEHVGVDVVVGPTQIAEGPAIEEYARTQPGVTFVNGTASGRSPTRQAAAPNFVGFGPDGAQMVAGLGAYAYKKLGWRTAVTVGEQEAFNYTTAAGFIAEFCALGGKVTRRIWVPLTAQDYGPFVAQVPRGGVDGFFMAGSNVTTIAFADRVPQLKGALARKMLAGILATSLEGFGRRYAGVVMGMPLPAPVGVPAPSGQRPWGRYIAAFAAAFPDLAFAGPYIFAVGYQNAMEAVLQALERVDGNLSDGQRRFQAALADLEFAAPNGPIRLDRNRRAVVSTYLQRIGTGPKGKLRMSTFRTVPSVERTFGGYFGASDPPPSETTPACVKRTAPPWAR